MIVMNLAVTKAAAKLKLLFNKTTSGARLLSIQFVLNEHNKVRPNSWQ
jgi:hypothetical protein